MPQLPDHQVKCWVFTFKEGLLSAVAHDLKIRVESPNVTIDDDRIEVKIDPSRLRVVCAQQDGRDAASLLREADKTKIEQNIRKDVLHIKRFPSIGFTGTATRTSRDRAEIEGELELHGRKRSVRCIADQRDGKWESRVRLHQPDFGIKPFSAMLGTLKVQADVEVVLEIELAQ